MSLLDLYYDVEAELQHRMGSVHGGGKRTLEDAGLEKPLQQETKDGKDDSGENTPESSLMDLARDVRNQFGLVSKLEQATTKELRSILFALKTAEIASPLEDLKKVLPRLQAMFASKDLVARVQKTMQDTGVMTAHLKAAQAEMQLLKRLQRILRVQGADGMLEVHKHARRLAKSCEVFAELQQCDTAEEALAMLNVHCRDLQDEIVFAKGRLSKHYEGLKHSDKRQRVLDAELLQLQRREDGNIGRIATVPTEIVLFQLETLETPSRSLWVSIFQRNIEGAGTFGTVFRGRSMHDNRPCVVKEIVTDIDLPRFIDEPQPEDWVDTKEWGALNVLHPIAARNIEVETAVLELQRNLLGVCVIPADADSGEVRTIIAMAQAPGWNMRDVIALHPEVTGFTCERFCECLAWLSRQLPKLHASGILHCDIKPVNIVIDCHNKTADFVDFGVSYLHGWKVHSGSLTHRVKTGLRELQLAPVASASTITTSSPWLVGTPAYTPPFVKTMIKGEASYLYSPASDAWSLGQSIRTIMHAMAGPYWGCKMHPQVFTLLKDHAPNIDAVARKLQRHVKIAPEDTAKHLWHAAKALDMIASEAAGPAGSAGRVARAGPAALVKSAATPTE